MTTIFTYIKAQLRAYKKALFPIVGVFCLGVSVPAFGMFNGIKQKLVGQAKETIQKMTPDINVNLGEDTKQTIQLTLTQLSAITNTISDKLEKIIQGSGHLRTLRKIQGQLAQLVTDVNAQVNQNASQSSAAASSIERKYEDEQGITPEAIKTKLTELKKELDELVTSFTALNNNGSAEQKERKENKENAEISLAEKLRNFQKKLAEFIDQLGDQNVPDRPNILATLQVIKEECDQLVKDFQDESMGGLYGTLEHNIQKLGTVMNSVVSQLSSNLCRNMSQELQQVIGFPALQTLKVRLENLNQQLQNQSQQYSVNDFQKELKECRDNLIAPVLTTITKVENKGTLQTSLEQLRDSISTAVSGQPTSRQEAQQITAMLLDSINQTLQARNGLNGVLQVFNQDIKKNMLQLTDNFSHQLAAQMEKTGERLIDRASMQFKRGALYVTSLALAAYSTYFLMNNAENPTKTKIGLGVLAASVAYPVYDSIRSWWYSRNKK